MENAGAAIKGIRNIMGQNRELEIIKDDYFSVIPKKIK